LLSLLLLLVGCASKSTPEPILIGHPVPANGPDKNLIENAKRALLLAVEESNKGDNLLGGRRIAVLHPEWPAGEPDTLKSVAVRLVTVDRVIGLLGGTNPIQANRLSRAAKDHEVPVLTPAELTPEFGDENLYSVNAGIRVKGQALARFAAQELKAARMVLLVDMKLPAGSIVAEAFQREFTEKKAGRADQFTFTSENEFPQLAERLKKTQPDAILLVAQASATCKLTESLQHAGIRLPLLFAGDEEHLASAGRVDAGSPLYWVSAFTPNTAAPQSLEFAKKYKERFDADPDISAALAYDSLRILLDAKRRADAQSAKILKVLSDDAKPFDSLTGSLTFEQDHTARRNIFVLSLKDKRPVIVKKIEPDGR
jgi:branched-chain amino acid transport system substrate-binding protein